MTQLPFSAEQFFTVFARYNVAVSPAQILLTGLALALIAIARSGRAGASRIVSLGLALLWAWTGIVYHLGFFSAINPAAVLFGLFCLLEAGIFLWLGIHCRSIVFARRRDAREALGTGLLIYALLVYPLLGALLGHRYPAAPTFGVPCPATTYTLGLLLWTAGPVPVAVAAIPLAWAAVGMSAALLLGMTEDLGLTVAALLTAFFAWRERRAFARSTTATHPGGIHATSSSRRPPA